MLPPAARCFFLLLYFLLTASSVSGSLRFVGTYVQAGLVALGDATRFAIFQSLAQRPRAVSELARTLPVSRPAVSQHLRVLKDAKLVSDRKAGTKRIYEVNPEGIALLREHFDKLWEQVFAAFQVVAEKSKEEKGHGRGRGSKSRRSAKNASGQHSG